MRRRWVDIVIVTALLVAIVVQWRTCRSVENSARLLVEANPMGKRSTINFTLNGYPYVIQFYSVKTEDETQDQYDVRHANECLTVQGALTNIGATITSVTTP